MATKIELSISPLGDRLVVHPEQREESYQFRLGAARHGQGKANGRQSGRGWTRPGCLTVADRQEMEVKEGQVVLFAKYAGTEIKFENEEYLIISEKDVLCHHGLGPTSLGSSKEGKHAAQRCRI